MIPKFPTKTKLTIPKVSAPTITRPLQAPSSLATEAKPIPENLPESNQVLDSLASLESALLNLHPTLPSLLQQILKHLKNDPAIVTILTPEQIGVIVRSLKQQTNTEIIATTTKGKKAKVTLDDI